jgi:hypothetical protein
MDLPIDTIKLFSEFDPSLRLVAATHLLLPLAQHDKFFLAMVSPNFIS